MNHYGAVYGTHKMTFLTWLDRFFERLFDDVPTSRVYALHMIVVGLSNVFDDGGNVNRAIIGVWGIHPALVHGYMLAIALASLLILTRKEPPLWLYGAGVSYVVLILVSVISLVLDHPSITTLSAAARIFALNGLLFFLLIKNLRKAL